MSATLYLKASVSLSSSLVMERVLDAHLHTFLEEVRFATSSSVFQSFCMFVKNVRVRAQT